MLKTPKIMSKSKRLLVSGGAGFVGSHLCERLIANGHKVLCYDDLSTGKLANISGLLKLSNFEFVEWDIARPFSQNVDEIYNLASPASPVHYQRDPIKTITTNVSGAMNLLELARRNNAKILQASTSEVYGDPHLHPQPESYWGHVNPIGKRSCYDEGKRCAETLFFDFHRFYGVPVRVVRIFNTFGPKMSKDDGRVVSNFIVQALSHEDITIFGDGSQTRSFQYVDDLVSGLILMMENETDFIGPVNLGNPGEFTIARLAEIVLSMIPESNSKLIYLPLPSDDPRQRRPAIGLAEQKLGWRPLVQLEEGLSRTIQYFRNCD